MCREHCRQVSLLSVPLFLSLWSLLSCCRFLDWPHPEGKAPAFDEGHYEVARYAMLKVRLTWGLDVKEGGGGRRCGVGGRGRVCTCDKDATFVFRNLTARHR